MNRFDLVIANCGRSELFWDSLQENTRNLDPLLDRIIIFDCSSEPEKELAKCIHYMRKNKLAEIPFLFFRRRNYMMNQGTVMDYVRLLGEGYFTPALFTFFMQDHYLNKKLYLKADTMPENFILDFDEVARQMTEDPEQVICATRLGLRICAALPPELCGEHYKSYDEQTSFEWDWVGNGKFGSIVNGKYCCDHFIYYNGLKHINGSKDICLAIDGSNFCSKAEYLTRHYFTNKEMYTNGISDYGGALVWETRLSKILADEKLSFNELSHGIKVRTPAELKSLHPEPGISGLWCYFYNSPLFFCMHGASDIWEYGFKVTEAYFRYAAYCAGLKLKVKKQDTLITVLFDSHNAIPVKLAANGILCDMRIDVNDLLNISNTRLMMMKTGIRHQWNAFKNSPFISRLRPLNNLHFRIFRKLRRILTRLLKS